jgi:Tfp pilus assembly protein PilF
MAAHPVAADRYFTHLFRVAQSVRPLVGGYAALSEAQRARAPVRYLHARILLITRGVSEATTELERTVAADPKFVAARLELAQLSLDRGDAAAAAKWLESVTGGVGGATDKSGETADELIELSAAVQARTGRADQGAALLDKALAERPADADLISAKAALLVRMGGAANITAAGQVLQTALNASPTAEKLYETLEQLYEAEASGGLAAGDETPADAARKLGDLYTRAAESIPRSRFVRSRLIQEALRAKNYKGATELLQRMLDEDGYDCEVLRELLRTLYLDGRLDEARALVQRRLSVPGAPYAELAVAQWLDLAVALDMLKKNQAPQAVELLSARLTGRVDDPAPVLRLLGQALIRAGQVPRIDDFYKQALLRWPQGADRNELMFERAMLWDRQGDGRQSEQLMREVLKADPGHAGANNGLGYSLADHNRDLEQARELIQRAVDSEPHSAAYLDSLGWAYYKLGKFAEARTQLIQAVQISGGEEPVLLDHLGDTLYRLGQKDDALRQWQAAAEALKKPDTMDTDDPDDKALAARLPGKLEAALVGKPVHVAVSPGAGDATTEPASQP